MIPSPSKSRTRVFLNQDRQLRFWKTLCLISVVVYTGTIWQFIARLSQEREYLVVGEDSVILGSALEFGKAEELHNRQSVLAMETLFNRHPGGIDNPGRLNGLFVDEALDKARSAVASEAEEFRLKHIHQKVEIESVTLTKVNTSSVLSSVTGQLIRTGRFEETPFTEALRIKAHFGFRENRSLTGSRTTPTLVSDFNYQTEPLDPR